MLKLLNAISGPLGGMTEKAVLAGFMYAAGKGYIPGDQVVPLAAALYGLLSAGYTAIVQTETAKIQAINQGDNGVKVVKESVEAPCVDHPLN